MLDEPGSEWTRGCWEEFEDCIASRVAFVEVRAALAAAHRADRLPDEEYAEAKAFLEFCWQQIHVIECDRALMRRAGELTESCALRGFDAVHLASVLGSATPDSPTLMITWDNDLARAAYESGISVIRTTDA